MPQTEPMSAEQLGAKIVELAGEGILGDKQKAIESSNAIGDLIHQRDRDILTKAAERALAWLSVGFVDEWLAPDAKESLRKAILAPINEKEGS